MLRLQETAMKDEDTLRGKFKLSLGPPGEDHFLTLNELAQPCYQQMSVRDWSEGHSPLSVPISNYRERTEAEAQVPCNSFDFWPQSSLALRSEQQPVLKPGTSC